MTDAYPQPLGYGRVTILPIGSLSPDIRRRGVLEAVRAGLNYKLDDLPNGQSHTHVLRDFRRMVES